MITNKPKFNVQEGGFNMSHYATAHGDQVIHMMHT